MKPLMMRAAIAYATALGWPVFPLYPMRRGKCSCWSGEGCRAAGKHPLTQLVRHGVLQATTDVTTIASWWSSWPDAGIGIATGHGFFVLDEDPRNGGDDSRAELESQNRPLPDSPRQITGGDGVHYLFALPDGYDVVASIASGLDVKGRGGYIVGAPTMHASGRRYTWDVGAHPLEISIADAPDWLIHEVVATPKRKHGPAQGSAAQSALGLLFAARGLTGAESSDGGRLAVRCPWASEHTDGRGIGNDFSTVVFAANEAAPFGWFHCSHGHCTNRRQHEVFRVLETK